MDVLSSLTDWVTNNANTLSGYVILIIGIILFVWALGTGRLYMGRNLDTILADKDAQIAACQASLLHCTHPPQGVT